MKAPIGGMPIGSPKPTDFVTPNGKSPVPKSAVVAAKLYAAGVIAEVERQLLSARGAEKIQKLNRKLVMWQGVLDQVTELLGEG